MLLNLLTFAQVAINNNGSAPNSNAVLDIDVSTNDKGILIPRLTTTERQGMTLNTTDEGLTVYDETTNNYWYWDGTQWLMLTSHHDAWLVNGNTGINSSNFLGTTDANDLIFKTNNTEILRITSDGKIGVGTSSPSTDIMFNNKNFWIIAPGGNVSDINSSADAVAISTGNYYSFNVYNNGTSTGASFMRNNNSSNTKPVLELEQKGTGEGILVTSYNSGIAFRGQTNTATKTAYFTNSTNDNNITVLYADYDGPGTSGNVAVYGEADDAGSGNGTGVKGKGGWAGIIGIGGTWAGRFQGNVRIAGDLTVTGTISKGGGSFMIDYPLDPENKFLYHSFVESPDMLNIYNGNVITDDDSIAVIQLPEYFLAVNKDFKYSLTVIGEFAQAIIYKEIDENATFVIKTSKPNVKVSWMVTGVRDDPYARKYRIPTVVDKEEDEKGKYLHPELYGHPETDAIDYYEETKENISSPNSKSQK